MPLPNIRGIETIGVNFAFYQSARNARTASTVQSVLRDMSRQMQNTEQRNYALARSSAMVAGVLATAGAALVAYGFAAAKAAADLDKLTIASRQIAANAGVGYRALYTQIKGIEKYTFTTQEATEAVNKLNTANATFVDTARLAAVAQDLAISRNMKAADVLNYLTDAIAKASAESLNQLDIGITNTRLFNRWAQAHKTTASAMSTAARQQAVYNYILEKGTFLQGAYANASDNASVILDKLRVSATNAFASLGAGAVEVLKPIAKVIQSVLDWYNGLNKVAQMRITKWGILAGIGMLTVGISRMIKDTVATFGPLLKAYRQLSSAESARMAALVSENEAREAANAVSRKQAAEDAKAAKAKADAEKRWLDAYNASRLGSAERAKEAAHTQKEQAKATQEAAKSTEKTLGEQTYAEYTYINAIKKATAEMREQIAVAKERAKKVATDMGGGKFKRVNIDIGRQIEHIADHGPEAVAAIIALSDEISEFLDKSPAFEKGIKQISHQALILKGSVSGAAKGFDRIRAVLESLVELNLTSLVDLFRNIPPAWFYGYSVPPAGGPAAPGGAPQQPGGAPQQPGGAPQQPSGPAAPPPTPQTGFPLFNLGTSDERILSRYEKYGYQQLYDLVQKLSAVTSREQVSPDLVPADFRVHEQVFKPLWVDTIGAILEEFTQDAVMEAKRQASDITPVTREQLDTFFNSLVMRPQDFQAAFNLWFKNRETARRRRYDESVAEVQRGIAESLAGSRITAESVGEGVPSGAAQRPLIDGAVLENLADEYALYVAQYKVAGKNATVRQKDIDTAWKLIRETPELLKENFLAWYSAASPEAKEASAELFRHFESIPSEVNKEVKRRKPLSAEAQAAKDAAEAEAYEVRGRLMADLKALLAAGQFYHTTEIGKRGKPLINYYKPLNLKKFGLDEPGKEVVEEIARNLGAMYGNQYLTWEQFAIKHDIPIAPYGTEGFSMKEIARVLAQYELIKGSGTKGAGSELSVQLSEARRRKNIAEAKQALATLLTGGHLATTPLGSWETAPDWRARGVKEPPEDTIKYIGELLGIYNRKKGMWSSPTAFRSAYGDKFAGIEHVSRDISTFDIARQVALYVNRAVPEDLTGRAVTPEERERAYAVGRAMAVDTETGLPVDLVNAFEQVNKGVDDAQTSEEAVSDAATETVNSIAKQIEEQQKLIDGLVEKLGGLQQTYETRKATSSNRGLSRLRRSISSIQERIGAEQNKLQKMQEQAKNAQQEEEWKIVGPGTPGPIPERLLNLQEKYKELKQQAEEAEKLVLERAVEAESQGTKSAREAYRKAIDAANEVDKQLQEVERAIDAYEANQGEKIAGRVKEFSSEFLNAVKDALASNANETITKTKVSRRFSAQLKELGITSQELLDRLVQEQFLVAKAAAQGRTVYSLAVKPSARPAPAPSATQSAESAKSADEGAKVTAEFGPEGPQVTKATVEAIESRLRDEVALYRQKLTAAGANAVSKEAVEALTNVLLSVNTLMPKLTKEQLQGYLGDIPQTLASKDVQEKLRQALADTGLPEAGVKSFLKETLAAIDVPLAATSTKARKAAKTAAPQKAAAEFTVVEEEATKRVEQATQAGAQAASQAFVQGLDAALYEIGSKMPSMFVGTGKGTVYDYKQAFTTWMLTASKLPDELLGTPGFRNMEAPLSQPFTETGGYQLNLAVAPEAKKAIDSWLRVNWPGRYEVISEERKQAEGRDFSIYVGSGRMARELANQIQTLFKDVLQEPVYKEGDKTLSRLGTLDTAITSKIGAQFNLSETRLGRLGGFIGNFYRGIPIGADLERSIAEELNKVEKLTPGSDEFKKRFAEEVSKARVNVSKQLLGLFGEDFFASALSPAFIKTIGSADIESALMPNIEERADAIIRKLEETQATVRDRTDPESEWLRAISPEREAAKLIDATNRFVRTIYSFPDQRLKEVGEEGEKLDRQLATLVDNLKEQQAKPENIHAIGEYEMRIKAVYDAQERRKALIAKDEAIIQKRGLDNLDRALTSPFNRVKISGPRGTGSSKPAGYIDEGAVKAVLANWDKTMAEAFLRRFEVVKTWPEALRRAVDKNSPGNTAVGLAQSLSENEDFKQFIKDDTESAYLIRTLVTALDISRNRELSSSNLRADYGRIPRKEAIAQSLTREQALIRTLYDQVEELQAASLGAAGARGLADQLADIVDIAEPVTPPRPTIPPEFSAILSPETFRDWLVSKGWLQSGLETLSGEGTSTYALREMLFKSGFESLQQLSPHMFMRLVTRVKGDKPESGAAWNAFLREAMARAPQPGRVIDNSAIKEYIKYALRDAQERLDELADKGLEHLLTGPASPFSPDKFEKYAKLFEAEALATPGYKSDAEIADKIAKVKASIEKFNALDSKIRVKIMRLAETGKTAEQIAFEMFGPTDQARETGPVIKDALTYIKSTFKSVEDYATRTANAYAEIFSAETLDQYLALGRETRPYSMEVSLRNVLKDFNKWPQYLQEKLATMIKQGKAVAEIVDEFAAMGMGGDITAMQAQLAAIVDYIKFSQLPYAQRMAQVNPDMLTWRAPTGQPEHSMIRAQANPADIDAALKQLEKISAQRIALENDLDIALKNTTRGSNQYANALNGITNTLGGLTPLLYALGGGLSNLAYQLQYGLRGVLTLFKSHWAIALGAAIIGGVIAAVKAKKAYDEKVFKQTLGTTPAEREAQFSLYSEEAAAADKARVEANTTYFNSLSKEINAIFFPKLAKQQREMAANTYRGLTDLEEAKKKLREEMTGEAERIWGPVYGKAMAAAINTYIDQANIKTISDIYRVQGVIKEQLKKAKWEDLWPAMQLWGNTLSQIIKQSIISGVNGLSTGDFVPLWTIVKQAYNKVWYGEEWGTAQKPGMGNLRQAEAVRAQSVSLADRARIAETSMALMEQAQKAMSPEVMKKDISGRLAKIDEDLKSLTAQSKDWEQKLKGVEEQLYQVTLVERALDKALRPYEETLRRVEAAATLITIPLERQRRALQKQIDAERKRVDQIRKRHEEENKALEEAIEAAEKRLEIDRERLQNLDWELFIEQTKNKIQKQETSARELQLKTEKLIVQDSVEQQEIALERMREQLEEQKKKQELELEAAEKQIEAAEAMMEALDEQIAAEQEKVTYAQEELELRKAMQVEQRIAVENQRTALEELQESMERQKQAVDEMVTKLEELKQIGETAGEAAGSAAEDSINNATTAAQKLGEALGKGMEIQMPGINAALDGIKPKPIVKDMFEGWEMDVTSASQQIAALLAGETPKNLRAELDQMPVEYTPTGIMLKSGWSAAVGGFTRDLTTELPTSMDTALVEVDNVWDKHVKAWLTLITSIPVAFMKMFNPNYTPSASIVGSTLTPQNRAAGFEGVVDRPRLFRIGEAGPEYVSIRPMRGTGVESPISRNVYGQATYNNSSSTVVTNNYNVSGVYGQTPTKRSIRAELELSAHMYH